MRDITPPSGISFERVDRRRDILARIDALQRRADIQQDALAAQDEYYQAAFNMITAPETKQAFDIASEDEKLREGYGRHKFGQSCLFARRLIAVSYTHLTLPTICSV